MRKHIKQKWNKYVMGLATASAVAAPIAASVSCGSSASYGFAKVFGATDGGSRSDQSFNNQALDAIKSFTGSGNNFLDSKGKDAAQIQAAYITAASHGAETILAAGFYHRPAIISARTNPATKDLKFILMDDEIANDDHVVNIKFHTEQAGFEAGYAAARYAASHPGSDNEAKVGTFGGAPSAPVTDYMFGFLQGVKEWNTANASHLVKVYKPSTNFIGNFDADQNGKVTNLANAMISGGADVIFPVGGPQQNTVLNVILKNGIDSKNNHLRVIGVDADFKHQVAIEKQDFVLTSALKNIATVATAALQLIYPDHTPFSSLPSHYVAVNDETRALFANGIFGHTIVGGLKENMVGLAQNNVLGDNPTEIAHVTTKAQAATTQDPNNYDQYLATFN